ncbi:hypothetical protein ACFL5Y_02290 [Candidatus Omnitrophota bacterium]
MKKKRAVMITVLVILLIVLFQTTINAKNTIGEKNSGTIPDNEYSVINEALNGAEQQGKLAGQTDMEDAFETDSGGVKQQIEDSVKAQNELENQANN